MPLPSDATLTLQGQPRPGDPLHKKPKQAMLFRMSAETFEQLEDTQNLKVHVEFGDTPRLCINDTFYPLRHDRETVPHELYLRMASAPKPMAPLKMYADVIGKFMVERQLVDKVQETVRDRTLEVEKQRTERKAIYLDTPPDLSYPGSKGRPRKDAPATAARRPAVASTSHAPSSTRASRVASPLPAASSHANGPTAESASTRARLIHCLALKPRTAESAIMMCGGREPSPQMRKELYSILRNVAETKPTAKNSDPNAPHLWQLRLESWREVRPYEWPSLTPDERLAMSRQARKAYRDLKIPESDPVWEYAHYRDLGASDAGPGSSAKPAAGPSAPEPKKGMMSKSTTKKTKPAEGVRKKVPDIIIAKDESARPARDEKGKARERDVDEGSAAGTPTSATRPPNRRLPGSGYKVKASATPPATEARANSPLPPPPKKAGPVDARENRREVPAPSGSAKPLPPIAPPAPPASTNASQPRKKLKDSTTEKRREERQSAALEDRPRGKVSASPVPASKLSFKRKKPALDQDDSEYSEREVPLSSSTTSKKRKVEPPPSPADKDKARVRDLSLPKKPAVHEPSPLSAPRTKVKKEPSPLSIAFSPPPSAPPRSSLPPRPSVPEKPQPPSSASSSSASIKDEAPHRASSSSKRRRSPIYTSSDDEGGSSDPRPPARSAEPPAKKHRTAPAVKARPPPFRPRSALPTDSAGLRRYYSKCWYVYIQLYNEQTLRRSRIERMLDADADGEPGAGGDPDATDEADGVQMEDLDPEALTAFMAEYNTVYTELMKIKKAWERLGGTIDAEGRLIDPPA